MKNILSQISARLSELDEAKSRIRSLSPAQLGVLQLLALGLSAKEIAEILHLSDKTIRTHLNNIYRVLGVHKATEAIRSYHYYYSGEIDFRM
jgi:DNA-binding NarL/FixJ family response regulator